MPPPVLLASPLAEPVDSSVVDSEPMLLEVSDELLALVSVEVLEAGEDVMGGVVVNGEVSACEGWQAGARPRARTMGRDRGRMMREA